MPAMVLPTLLATSAPGAVRIFTSGINLATSAPGSFAYPEDSTRTPFPELDEDDAQIQAQKMERERASVGGGIAEELFEGLPEDAASLDDMALTAMEAIVEDPAPAVAIELVEVRPPPAAGPLATGRVSGQKVPGRRLPLLLSYSEVIRSDAVQQQVPDILTPRTHSQQGLPAPSVQCHRGRWAP